MKGIIKDIMQTLRVVAVFVVATTVIPKLFPSIQVQMGIYAIVYALATTVQNNIDKWF